MTNRKALLQTLSILFVTSWLVFAGWFGFSWKNSKPYSVETVLGASTSQEAITLAPYPKTLDSTGLLRFGARHYILYNPESGKVLLGESADDSVPIASTTKIMTTYLVNKYGDYKDTAKVTQTGATQIGSLMGLFTGEEMTIDNLVYGAMLVSGNDAAHTLGEYVGGILLNDPNASEDARIARFVEEMNTTASALGMTHTKYSDPSGLNDEGRSSAHDIAKLLSQYILEPHLRDVISTAQYTATNLSGRTKHELRNSNRLVADYQYEGSIGGKTGFTPDAGHCLASSATRNGITLIAVALNTYSTSKEASAITVKDLLNYGFSQFEWH